MDPDASPTEYSPFSSPSQNSEENADDTPNYVILDPQGSRHPLLRFNIDEIYSPTIVEYDPQAKEIIQAEASKLDIRPFKLLERLKATVFDNRDQDSVREDIAKLNLPQQSVCGKLITSGDTFVRCIDCDHFPDLSAHVIQCTQCFAKADHTGHRIFFVRKGEDSPGDCDCGSSETFDPAGHCSDHKHRELDLDILINNFPKDTLHNFKIMVKKILYKIISYYELVQKAAAQGIYGEIFFSAESLLDELLIFCIDCYSNINPAFSIILGMTLQETFQAPYNSVWHTCEDVKAEKSLAKADVAQHHECKCSLIANILRLGGILTIEIQDRLVGVIAECMKEATFKKFFAVEFARYAHFLYGNEYYSDTDNEYKVNSKLLKLNFQVYSLDRYPIDVFEAGAFQTFIDIMIKTINNSSRASNGMMYVMRRLSKVLLYFLNPNSVVSKRLLLETDIIEPLFTSLTAFQAKHFNSASALETVMQDNLNYNQFNNELMIENAISSSLESIIRLISRLPADLKLTYIQKILEKLLSCLQLIKPVLEVETQQEFTTLHPALEKILCELIRNCVRSLSQTEVEAFLTGMQIGPCQIAEIVLEGVLRTLGIIRGLHMLHNYRRGSLWKKYYWLWFFERDIFSIQTLVTLLPAEKTFEVLVSNFFSYSSELQLFFTEPWSLKADNQLKYNLFLSRSSNP